MALARASFEASTIATGKDTSRPGAVDFAWRILILLNVFRLAVSVLLLGIFLLVDEPRIIGDSDETLALFTLISLLVASIVEVVLLRRRVLRTTIHTFFQFGADLTAMTLIVHASGGISSGLGGVLIVSVGGLALLVPAERGLLIAAVATLVLLLEQAIANLQGMTTSAQYAPVGVLGAVMFVIAAVAQLLRNRIVETEALAEQRGVDLRNLVELNEYIVQHLRESIVVVDGENNIRLINESAANHLAKGAADIGPSLSTVSPELTTRLFAWRDQADHNDKPISAFHSTDGATDIQPHFAQLGNDRQSGVVIFLEDTSLIAERVQQAKLAALGRLSASIAHEIRNPLGAMSHAGQLLAESPDLRSEDRRLTDIIRSNARRVSQIVESILALSRRDKTHPKRLRLNAWLQDFAKEFVQTLELYEGAVEVNESGPDLEVQMDPTHLHQIMWNLCDNSVRYASEVAGAISVELRCGHMESGGRPFIEVADRGPGISAEKSDEIFEPFYTTRSSGTGLGLYISRELAERNGSTLRYYPRPGGGSLFRIVFSDPKRWQTGEEAQ